MAAPRLLAVRSYPDSVELLLDQPLEGTVLGFTPQSANRLWVTEPGLTVELLRRLADEVAAPYPALVSLGEVDGGDLLVDIETAGILCIHDGDQKPDDLFARISIEVSTSRWGDFFDIITVGDVADFAGFERNRRHPSIDDGLDALAATAREIDESLLVLGASSTVAPRVSYALGDGWTPSIFISDQPLDQRQIERLRTIIGTGGRGVGALLMGNKPAGDWNLRCDTGSAHLDPVDLDITPLAMPQAHVGGIDALLGDAATGHLDPDEIEAKPIDIDPIDIDPIESDHLVTSQDAVPVAEDAAVLETDRRSPNEGSTNEPAPPAHPVPSDALTTIEEAQPVGAPPMVRVLGVVGIDNMEHDGRRKVVELIVYLALHPDGVSSDRLTEALWPDETPASNTLSRNVCYARKALGLDGDANNHLPRISTEGRYRLGPHVRCDLLEFVKLAKKARDTDDEGTKVRLLSAALELVRDKPFDSVVEYEWAWTENWTAVAETEIADAALTLTDLHLRANRGEDARRATLAGLRAAPEDHRLRDRIERLA